MFIQSILTSLFCAAAEMDHWWRIPELGHLPFDIQKEIAIPMEIEDGEEVFSSCSYYNQDYSNYTLDDWIK